MQDSNKLIKLVEQAACSINMLDPTDLSELDKLQKILEQIDESIVAISDGPATLLEEAKGTTADAAHALQNMLKDQAQNAETSVETISQAVTSLQALTEQIEKTTDQPETAQATTETKTKAKSKTKIKTNSKAEPEAVVETEPETVVEAEPEAVDEAPAPPQIIDEDDVSLVQDFIAESVEHIEAAEAGLLDLESKPDDNEVLNLIFRSFHTIKGMAGFLNLGELGSLAHSAENLLDNARKGELVLVGKNTDVIFESVDMLKNMIAGLNESISNGTAIESQKELPSLVEKLELAAQGQEVATSPVVPQSKENDEVLDQVLVTKEAPKEKYTASKPNVVTKAKAADEKIKVSTTRLDNLVNMAGELVIAQLMVEEKTNDKVLSRHELTRRVAHQGKIIRDLQELSMSMRMVPISGVFQKMARLVRDLSQKAGKQISFVTSGEETELDRSIVDKIADPLVHMVRNSIDHGVEGPDERAKTDKDQTGQIELRAFHQAGNIVIEIQDDGRGLDKNRILKKAIESGVVDANQNLSDDELYKLIFHAGLSTAQKITSISGRGVGMDVVKKNLEALRGKIDISTELGKGTTFTIRMPLTLAIIDGQIVQVGTDRYIIPINSIVRTLKPTADQISSVHGRGEMVLERGELMPLMRLHDLFDIEANITEPTESLLVIVEEDNKRCCLLVDELQGQQQVVIKSLGESLGNAKGVSGGAIMGDGRISLILDIPGLMELAQG